MYSMWGRAAPCGPAAPWRSALPPVYFGERLPIPIYDRAIQIPTPAGATCGFCGDPIIEGERGFLMAFPRQIGPTLEAVHTECGARGHWGSVPHLVNTCPCGTNEETDDRPWREQGRDVLAMFIDDPDLLDAQQLPPMPPLICAWPR